MYMFRPEKRGIVWIIFQHAISALLSTHYPSSIQTSVNYLIWGGNLTPSCNSFFCETIVEYLAGATIWATLSPFKWISNIKESNLAVTQEMIGLLTCSHRLQIIWSGKTVQSTNRCMITDTPLEQNIGILLHHILIQNVWALITCWLWR